VPLLVAVIAVSAAAPVQATFHLWRIKELYSNASGSVQFIELQLPSSGLDNESFVGGHTITDSALGHTFTFPSNTPTVPGNGANLLIATSGYSALSGAVAPDFTLPNDFFSTAGDTINYSSGISTVTFPQPVFPTDGYNSLNFDPFGTSGTTIAPNSERNLAGQTGSVAPAWLAPVSGNWSVGSNWNLGAAPNSPGAVAIFNKATTAALTITLDAPETVGSLTFGNSASNSAGYILSGSNALTLNNSGSNTTITVTGGSQGINVPVVLASNLVVTTSPSNTNAWTLRFGTASDISQSGSGSFSLTMSGTGGKLILSGTDTYTGGTSVEAGTLVVTSNTALANGSNLTVGNKTSLLGPISPDLPPNADLLPRGTNAVPEPDTLLLAFAAAVVANVCLNLRRRNALPAGPILFGGLVRSTCRSFSGPFVRV
jgi:autotransporter-associated beta strand protein